MNDHGNPMMTLAEQPQGELFVARGFRLAPVRGLRCYSAIIPIPENGE